VVIEEVKITWRGSKLGIYSTQASLFERPGEGASIASLESLTVPYIKGLGPSSRDWKIRTLIRVMFHDPEVVAEHG